jgi:hypothetical protein
VTNVATWSYDPDLPELPYLPLETLPAKGVWRVVATCEELYCVHTHFIGRRTLPCLGEGCGACAAQKPRRKEAFASVVRVRDRKHIILRLTENAAIVLLRSVIGGCPVRGLAFVATRTGSRPNGYVSVEVVPVELETHRLPVAPDLPLHLSRVWRIDGWEPAIGLEHYGEQLIAHIKRLENRKEGNDAA